jgi:hypothetical protein
MLMTGTAAVVTDFLGADRCIRLPSRPGAGAQREKDVKKSDNKSI